MKKIQLIGLLFIITNLSLFGQKDKWELLDDKEYFIQYPASWELNQSGLMGASFFY